MRSKAISPDPLYLCKLCAHACSLHKQFGQHYVQVESDDLHNISYMNISYTYIDDYRRVDVCAG